MVVRAELDNQRVSGTKGFAETVDYDAFVLTKLSGRSQQQFILRFILPCKSDCQPIFLNKQGIYLLYAKL